MDYARYYVGPLMMIAGALGMLLGGPWTWLGFATFPALIAIDLLALRPDFSRRDVRHPALVDVPLYLHALLVPALVGAAAWRIRANGASMSAMTLAGIAVSIGWLGVVPNIPFIHELMHRRGALPRLLAFLLAAVLLEPARRIAHLRGHHSKLGLDEDSDTARRGESIYAFVFRAAIGGSIESYRCEAARLARQGRSLWSWRSDLVRSFALIAAVFAALGAAAGVRGVLVVGAGFLISRLLLESFNYLQHYGLVRAPNARYARRHTWSHLTPLVRAAALEITNHAHHHMNPDVPFYALTPDPEAPQMPSALLCFLAALVPPLWEHLIAMPRLRDWDERFATPEERALAAAANAAAGWPAWGERRDAEAM
jgi:alkane 1-monooxygenase